MTAWRVLCYHTVEAGQAAGLARQLRAFARRGYRFCSLSEGLRLLAAGAGGRWLTVSFDDADRTVAEQAQPVLDEQGARAILYLTTEYVLRGRSYGDRPARPALTWGQLGRWLGAGHEVGGHTHTHADLLRCSAAGREEELGRSRELIASHLGVTAVHLSYPWGRHDARLLAHLRASGRWHSAATIDRGLNRPRSDPFRLRRDLISPGWPDAQVRLRLAVGDCAPLYRLQRSLRGWLGALPAGNGGRPGAGGPS